MTLDLPPELEQEVEQEAQAQGQDPARFLILLLSRYGKGISPDPLDDNLKGDAIEGLIANALREFHSGLRPAPRIKRPYNQAALIAALDSFDEGDAEEQRETLAYLKMAIDRDRPGQRSIFGEGINPMPPMDEIG